MMAKITVEKLVALGGKLWEKGDMKRVYFNYEELASFYGLEYDGWKFTVDGEKVSNNSGRQFTSALHNGKFWFDLVTGEFTSKGMSERMTAKIIDRITEAVTKLTEAETKKEAEMTKTDEPEVAEAVNPGKEKLKLGEAIKRLDELKETIYEALNEMEEILREVSPDVYAMSKSYWLAHIDAALENRDQWLGLGEASLVSYIDTILTLEELELEEMMKEEQEN